MNAPAASAAPRIVLDLARLAGVTRIGFGAAFVIAPRAAARPWAGAGAGTAGAQLLTRSMGVRDLLLGVGLVRSLKDRDHSGAATWLAYGAAAGMVDAAATLAAYRELPRSGRAFLVFITAALGVDAVLAAAISRPGSSR